MQLSELSDLSGRGANEQVAGGPNGESTMTKSLSIKHDGDLLFLGTDIGLNRRGCERLAEILVSPFKDRKELAFKLRSRAALIAITDGCVWSEP